MSASQEALLIAPEVDPNLSDEERIKVERELEKEIARWKHKCVKQTNTIPASKDVQKIRCLEKKLNHLVREKKELDTKLKVAYAPCHVRRYDQQLKQIEDHIRIQENLALEVKSIRTEMKHLQSQIKRLDKEHDELKKKTQSDYCYQNRVIKAQKQLENVENSLDHMKKRRAKLITENQERRNIIENMLHDRKLFHQHWKRLVDELNFNKKFLIDMIERIILSFNQSEELCNKIDAVKSRAAREEKLQRQEMMELQRKINNEQKNHEFLSTKGFHRDMCDLDPKEVRRRNMVKADYAKKIELYETIIGKAKKIYGVKTIPEFIQKYEKHEDAFFAHFNYLNEINRQFEEANCIFSSLKTNVKKMKEEKVRTEVNEEESLEKLKEELIMETEKTQQLKASLMEDEMRVEGYFRELQNMLINIGYDGEDLKKMLGETGKITKQNFMRYLAAMEERINHMSAEIFSNPETKDDTVPTKSLVSIPKEIVKIEEVVSTQQCAECAEGQDVNKYDEAIVLPKTRQEILQAVKAKAKAPEMQYRLHNLSKCKLPRSRILVNKRYQ